MPTDSRSGTTAGSVVSATNSGLINTGIINQVNHYHATNGTQQSKEQTAQQVVGYLKWLQERTQYIELRGIERSGEAPVARLSLATAYVPLRARPMALFGHTTPLRHAPSDANVDMQDDAPAHQEEADTDLNQVLGLGNRLAIIGGPGCGKTTVLLHMAWALASSLLSGEPEPACSCLGLSSAGGELPLPIFVPLASFARHRRGLPAHAPALQSTLAHFISHHLILGQADFGLPADFFVQLLKEGHDVILLLDGLDEVANEDERALVREAVEQLVSGRPALRVVVTCRPIAYHSGRTALGAGFREIAVQALDHERHIAPMVHQAYACIHPTDAAQSAALADDLLRGIQTLEAERHRRLGQASTKLIDSPLMVRLLLIVHFNNRRLPDERAELFERAINALLQVDYGREESDIRELATNWKLFRDMAQHLAFHMHRQGLDQGREIDEATLIRALREEPEFVPRIEDFLNQARLRGSLLEERNGVYRFIHLAFQEFLVARYLRDVTGSEGRTAIIAALDERLTDPWWREPILLLAGHIATGTAKPARDFLTLLAAAGTTPDAQFSAAELAGCAALEWRDSGIALRAACGRRILDLLEDKTALKESQPVLRARAGDVLARLGDQRFDPQCLHLPVDAERGFVCIAADADFKIGTRRADVKRIEAIIGREVEEYETNDAPTPTPTSEFYIARYPVTVAQFRAFAEATDSTSCYARALTYPDTRPVSYINWADAKAYCDWLHGQFAASPALAGTQIAQLIRTADWRLSLPSELEWEQAARGGVRNKLYSWGDEFDANQANVRESGIHASSAVGCFPANGYELHDMLGNVWEWTRSPWRAGAHPQEDSDDGSAADQESPLLVRGGSWYFGGDYAPCTYRYGYPSVNRNVYLGFRVVLRSAPET